MVIVDMLSDVGYTVLEATDGQSGLQILASRARIDLLLTDVGLPGGMNGRQLAETARRQRPDLQVLFATGYAESVAGTDSRMQPDMQVMSKPFALDALVARIQYTISGKPIERAPARVNGAVEA